MTEFPDRLDRIEQEAAERARLFATDELMADTANRLSLKRRVVRQMSEWPGGTSETF